MSASSTPTESPFALQRQREIGGDRRFADAALARGDRDDRAHARRERGFAPRPAGLRRRGVPVARARGGGAGIARRAARLGGQDRGHRQHAGQRLDRLLGGLAQRFEARAALGLDLDRKADIAVADDDARDHAERDDVAALSGSRTAASASRTCRSVTAIRVPALVPTSRRADAKLGGG